MTPETKAILVLQMRQEANDVEQDGRVARLDAKLAWLTAKRLAITLHAKADDLENRE